LIALTIYGLPWIDGLNEETRESLTSWQAGIGVLFGFLGVILVEVLRILNEARRDAHTLQERKRALATGLRWEIEDLVSELETADSNLDGLERQTAPSLNADTYASAQLSTPVVFPRVVEQLSLLFEREHGGDFSRLLTNFYRLHLACRRRVARALGGHVGKTVPPRNIAAVLRLFRATKKMGKATLTELRPFLGRPQAALQSTEHRQRGKVDQSWWRDALARLARCWQQTRMLYRVLLLIRFSLLLGLVGALVLLFNDQAQDVLRVLGEDAGWPVLWFLVAVVLGAAVAWWSARVMFYFRFRNPASSPHVFPMLKEYLPRALGASVLVLTAIALLQASFSYDGWLTGPAGRLRLLALALLLLAAGFVYVTVQRRVWFARWTGGPRPADLRSLRELHWQAWLPLVLAAAFGFGLMILFAYRSVQVAPYLGSATVALLAVVGL
jgi:hypothetical protein